MDDKIIKLKKVSKKQHEESEESKIQKVISDFQSLIEKIELSFNNLHSSKNNNIE